MRLNRNELRLKRHTRLRKKVVGTGNKPRLNVFRSNRNVFVQLIDDSRGRTIVSASGAEVEFSEKMGTKTGVEKAYELGKLIATRASDFGVKRAVFDRGGYAYHGSIKAVADGAREAGLQF